MTSVEITILEPNALNRKICIGFCFIETENRVGKFPLTTSLSNCCKQAVLAVQLLLPNLFQPCVKNPKQFVIRCTDL